MGMHYSAAPWRGLQQFPFLSRIMAEAPAMRLNFGLVLLSLHKPLDIAEQIATVDVMSGGRVILGVALGYRDVEYLAFGARRLTLLDLLYRIYIAKERGTVDGAPTLAVEILSPSTARSDRQTKRQLFERYGVPYYWIVDSDARAIEVYRAVGGVYGAAGQVSADELIDLPPFPGLRIDPAALWR